MSPSVYVTLFNQKVQEFFKDLTTAFPTVTQFSQFKTGVQLMKSLDEKRMQKMFHEYVYVKYAAQINARDEGFFMKRDLVDDAGAGDDQSEDWSMFIDNLRAIWKTMGEDNKKTIWNYFLILVKLNEKCIGK